MFSILIVDNDLDFAEALRISLEEKDFSVAGCSTIARCNEFVKIRNFDLVIIDLDVEDGNCEEFLAKLRKTAGPEIIVLVKHGEVNKAINAMKLGARDVYIKPVDIDSLIIDLESIQSDMEVSSRIRKRGLIEEYSFDKLASKNINMQKILDEVRSFAETDVNILITGESGTGKGLLARTIHANSQRSERDFIEINCSAIPSTLLESELFGYERGAFTDARETRRGLFELANQSTLFLDEISTMDYNMQSKLLKVIEDFKFYRIGGRKEIEVDTRLVAATNADLKKLVSDKEFREDLYYRLNVASVHLPPLRERKRDIVDLFLGFIDEFNKTLGRDVKRITPEVADALTEYHWPGNIRELKNVCERIMVIIKGDTISKALLRRRYLLQQLKTGRRLVYSNLSRILRKNISWLHWTH